MKNFLKISMVCSTLLVTTLFADIKAGDKVTSTGSYGCKTQQEAIGIYDLQNDSSMSPAIKINVIGRLLDNKYRSCKKIISGLDIKVIKIENWGPKSNRFKYKLLMVQLPNQDYRWTIIK